jgi:stage III sporulation protein AH
MLLKKQTVWLLTMLSLVVVLSVYYLTAPEQTNSDLAAVEQVTDQQETAEESTETTEESTETAENSTKSTETDSSEMPNVTISSADDEFEALRMEIEDERAKLNEEYTTIMGDTALSAEERNKAVEANKQLSEAKVSEGIIETMIVQMNYDAALVRVDGNDVNVTVKADEQLSRESVVEIMDLVENEIQNVDNIAVDFQPNK